MASSAHASLPPLPAVQRYFEISLYLLVSTGILAIVSTGKLDIFSILVPPIALAFKCVRLCRGRGPELSARAATGLVLAYFLFSPLDVWAVSRSLAAGAPNPALYAGLLAAIHLLLFATLVRLYSARTNRDYAFLAVLAVTSMLAAAVLTVETSFLAVLAVFLVLAVSTFVALEIRRSAIGAVSPPLALGSPLARRLNRALGITSVLVALSALALGGVIFFLIPRFTTGYLGALSLQPTLMTGFTDSVTLGEIGQIQKSRALVMRIRILGDPSRAESVHWRGLVLTNFDGKRWFTPPRDRVVVSPASDGTYWLKPMALPPGESRLLRYTVQMEPMATDAIFLASRAESVRGRFGSDGESGHPGFLAADDTDSVFNPLHNATKIRFEGTSLLPAVPLVELRGDSAAYPDSIRDAYLQLPPLNPRIKQLAEQITSRSGNEYDKTTSIELYLKARYAYTLDLTGRGAGDAMTRFLFVNRAGNCEYFASALTVMLRSIGIPARYVDGFLSGEYNSVGGDYIVRQSDAHAWVEVYFPGYGWLTFDPTPAGSGASEGLLGRAGLYWDWFQFEWSEWVINYDFSHQITLAQNLHRSSHDWNDRLRRYYRQKERQTMEAALAFDQRLEASRYLLPGALVFLVALLLYLRGRSVIGYIIERWRLRARRGGNVTASLASLEYREMLRLLEKRGWKKGASQTAAEFAAAIQAAAPPPGLAGPVTQLTELYQSARFGTHPAPAERMSLLLRSIRSLLQTRKQSAL